MNDKTLLIYKELNKLYEVVKNREPNKVSDTINIYNLGDTTFYINTKSVYNASYSVDFDGVTFDIRGRAVEVSGDFTKINTNNWNHWIANLKEEVNKYG